MMKVIILSIGLISTINASSSRLLQSACGGDPNAELTSCNGHCRPTCATGPNIVCTLQCVPGCNCVDGYILDEADGTCIPEGDCPNSCGSFEEYNSCGSACPASCDNQSPGPCIAVCVPGCFCQDGYIRDSNGRCILESECPALPGGETCPLRCVSGFDGCNGCGCDGLGNPTFCTKRACQPDEIGDASCSSCELGYTLNTATNTCDSAKVSCTNTGDCDQGFKCREDPECGVYSDIECADTGKVCLKKRNNNVCTSDADCNQGNGFACLNGDVGDGICVKYQ